MGNAQLKERYEIGAHIGHGGYGQIYLVYRKPERKAFICKRVSRLHDHAKEEVRILKMLDHPNIVKFRSSYINLPYYYVILEYIPGGSLRAAIRERRMSVTETKHIIREITGGLAYLHSRGITHRDLKPENIMYAPGTGGMPSVIKIIDFGLASDKARMSSRCGTPGYMAPEMIDGKSYTSAVDLYSLGVIICELLHGRRVLPPAIRDQGLIRQLLDSNPKKRPSAEQILAHPWMQLDRKISRS